MDRRALLGVLGMASLGASFGASFSGRASAAALAAATAPRSFDDEPLMKNPISLAQWSLHRHFGLGSPQERNPHPANPVDFPKIAKDDYGIARVEYVNQFYRTQIAQKGFAEDLRKRCDDLAVTSVLIMCDGEGLCGAEAESARATFASNHEKWLAMAKTLGCHAIRVNAIGEGDADAQVQRCADGLTKLLAVAKPFDLNVIVENHGGLSSDGEWVVRVMKQVNDPRCGTLPDFGNWRDASGVLHDPVKNTTCVLPFAKGVSAKSYDFNEKGDETLLDYPGLLKAVAASTYAGAIGIEYEGKRLSEPDGIRATKKILERFGCRA